MNASIVLGLLSGLALFLYGMQMMSNGLEAAAGNRMKKILEKLTANRLLGVLVGAAITAVIQSSSATTVMTVGFVNSGMMTLQQAVWIIMGANIGTTITGQLIALDVNVIAPLFAIFGVAMIIFLKSPKLHHIGKIIAGLGILFIGMDIMGSSMEPLRESDAFIALMTRFSNPLLGILAGAVFTAIIQSSSASVGILQTLAAAGLIPFSSAVYVLFGQNIGTCVTAVLASVGTNRNAKRTTAIHLFFNIIGTILFTILCQLLPLADWIAAITPNETAAQIANMHTLFNITTTLLLLPLGTWMAKLALILLPEAKEPIAAPSLSALTEEYGRNRTSLGASAIHMDLLRSEIHRMITLAGENTKRSFQAVIDSDNHVLQAVEETESIIDTLNKEISQYIAKILVNNHNGENIADIEEYFLITGNAERIGDHALNIAGYLETILRKSIVFSKEAQAELIEMQTITERALNEISSRNTETTEWLSAIAAMEQQMDDMTRNYREQHLDRMRSGHCSAEACILYSELLTDFERIGDHILNIAQAYAKIHLAI